MNPVTRDLVDTTLADADLTAFSNALSAAGLVKELRGPGPFTLFAPTDEAFRKLPPEEVEALMGDKRRLGAILHYHVLRGRLHSWDLSHGNAKTIEGNSVSIGATDDGMTVDRANVTKKDIHSTNGVIHAIDTVMMPGQQARPGAADQESAWSGKRRTTPISRRS